MTPLKSWAIVSFILGFMFFGVATFAGVKTTHAWKEVREGDYIVIRPQIRWFDTPVGSIPQFTLSEESFASRKIRTLAQAWTFLTLLLGALWLWFFMYGVNLNRADTLLGDTFLRCPFCFGSNVAFDVALFRVTDRVICRDCHASWEFYLNMLSMSLNRLRLVDYGIALREEEKNAVPKTDDPERWRTWAKERLKQERRPSPASLPEQKQTLYCRFCGHPNLPDANFCSACGRQLKA